MVNLCSMKYRMLEKTQKHKGFFRIDAYRLEHQTFEGGTLEIVREHLERGNAVAILLYDEQHDEVLLIEQFRIGPAVAGDKAWLIEVVAGMVDAGEDIEQAARREAVEESGYLPERLQSLGGYYSTPGGSSEWIDLFLGYVDRDQPVAKGGGEASEHEDIQPFWLSRQEAMQWLEQGKINSGGPMLCLLRAFGCQGLVQRG